MDNNATACLKIRNLFGDRSW